MQQIKEKEDILGNILEQWAQVKNKFNTESFHQREQAIESLKKQGLPVGKNEMYKYTPITRALEKEFTFKESNAPASLSSEDLKQHFIPNLEGNILVFINGVFSKENSSIQSPKALLEVTDLKEAYTETSNETTSYGLSSTLSTDPFKELNIALAESGVYFKVPAGKVLDKPLILYFITDASKGKVIQHTRNIFSIGENSQADIIEYHTGGGDHASFANGSTEIFVHENAVASYCKVENESEKSIHVDNTTIHQAGKSVFTALTLSLSGGLIRNNLSISLNDSYCESNMYGLYLLKNKQHVDNNTTVDHKQPHCLSNELYKGIMDDNATGVFNGKIYVRPHAQKTNAFQSNKNILLSDDATINTKPQLEIWADDVKCSHGATTGQLDEEQLFYLRSRGLGKETARTMLLYAFAIDILDKIKHPALKEYLDNLISDRLQN